MKLFKKFSSNSRTRQQEIEYYKNTLERHSKGKQERFAPEKKKTKIDPKWWIPASNFASVFSGLGIVGLIQLIAMAIHNLNKHNVKVGYFFNSGLFVYYILFLLIYVPIIRWYWRKKWRAIWFNNNIMFLTGDLDEYDNDAYLQTMDHITSRFDVVPDAGLWHYGNVVAIVGHVFSDNKGIKKVNVPEFDKSIDGYVLRDENGKVIKKLYPMFDKDFANDLYEAGNVPKHLRKFYDMREYDYNPVVSKKDGGDGKSRVNPDRKPYNTVADFINNEFVVSEIDTERPAGVYFYDTKSSNTILLGITRSGKGQTYIEVIMDIWRRAMKKCNHIFTDPKAELINKFYYSYTKSGFDVVQFNLLEPSLTNVFNPLINSILLFRQNDETKGASIIDSLVNLVFPDVNGEIWNKAAGNMFRRAVYTLFDYTIEQEKYLRYLAYKNNTSVEILENSINELYSKVTLFNVNELIAELASKISKDSELINMNKSVAPVAEKDLLSVLFDAISMLPTNKLRSLAVRADQSIKPIGGAQQTIAGVYASLLTNMSIYTDPTTIYLLSGSIQESFDISGLGFPRRFGIEFDSEFIKRYNLVGEMAYWSFYKDSEFKVPYESDDFKHTERIKDTNWIWCFWGGILADNVSYIKLEIKSLGVLVDTFYFKFTKGYKTINGISYLIDEVTKDKVIQGGFLIEWDKKEQIEKPKTFSTKALNYKNKSYDYVEKPVIISTQVFYTEKPKAIFLIVPPNKQHYQKHPLMIVSQLFNEGLELSYSTKSNTKPIVETKCLFDEFGNIRDNDKGIPALDAIVSIGLGQGLQLTLVLQAFEQLRSLYGSEVEKVVKSNTANIIFLKSNEKDTIDEIIRLSGVKHDVRTKGLNYQSKVGDIITVGEPTISYSRDIQENSVLKTNDLLFLAGEKPGNSVTIISNEMPILNKNEHIMPCAYKLHRRLPQRAIGKYSQKDLPTTKARGVQNFLENTINGEQLVKDRVAQAKISVDIKTDIMELVHKYNVSINEINGELSDYMMNFVYEEFDRQTNAVRLTDGHVKTYFEIAQDLRRMSEMLNNPNLEDHIRRSVGLNLRDLLYELLDDDTLTNLTNIYRDSKTLTKSLLDFEDDKVYMFILAMQKEFPEENRLEDLRTISVFEEADKIPEYRNRVVKKTNFEFDIRNTYHAKVLNDIIYKSYDEGEYIRSLTLKELKGEVEVYLNNVHIATLENPDEVLRYVVPEKEYDVICDLVVNDELLYNEIKFRLDEETKIVDYGD